MQDTLPERAAYATTMQKLEAARREAERAMPKSW